MQQPNIESTTFEYSGTLPCIISRLLDPRRFHADTDATKIRFDRRNNQIERQCHEQQERAPGNPQGFPRSLFGHRNAQFLSPFFPGYASLLFFFECLCFLLQSIPCLDMEIHYVVKKVYGLVRLSVIHHFGMQENFTRYLYSIIYVRLSSIGIFKISHTLELPAKIFHSLIACIDRRDIRFFVGVSEAGKNFLGLLSILDGVWLCRRFCFWFFFCRSLLLWRPCLQLLQKFFDIDRLAWGFLRRRRSLRRLGVLVRRKCQCPDSHNQGKGHDCKNYKLEKLEKQLFCLRKFRIHSDRFIKARQDGLYQYYH